MVPRELRKYIARCLSGYPAVAILGARQTGKTTLAKTFSEVYFDLEMEPEKLRLDFQWEKVILSKTPGSWMRPRIFQRYSHASETRSTLIENGSADSLFSVPSRPD